MFLDISGRYFSVFVKPCVLNMRTPPFCKDLQMLTLILENIYNLTYVIISIAKKLGGEMMIYTCTMNLAIDLFIKTAQMLPSEVNRTDEAVYMPNGKGVNVSFILKELGIDSTAHWF